MRRKSRFLLAVAALLTIACVAGAVGLLRPDVYRAALDSVRVRIVARGAANASSHDDGAESGEQHHDHNEDHPGHDEANALAISKEAKQTIGLKVVRVALKPFQRSIVLPAMVVERPGRSVIRMTAPLTGVVTAIEAVKGEAVSTGQPLFTLRLTHEELVQAQADLLRSLGELDVVKRELKRLEPLAEEGLVAKKTLFDRQYEQHRLEAVVAAGRQALALHGLTSDQIEKVVAGRQLFKELTVATPDGERTSDDQDKGRLLQVQELAVDRGQQVNAGDLLCVLADHAELYIEGTAFEQDARQIDRAIADNVKLIAVFDIGGTEPEFLRGLEILYAADTVDPQSRAFHFYARLPNSLVRDSGVKDRHRFISWKFKPGERLKLQVPVETWRKSIVLPVDAIVADGAESFVFVRYGGHFDRRAVRVEYRDPYSVVVANDGALRLGDSVAASGAEQLQLALKNKSGGGIDPHAGHNH